MPIKMAESLQKGEAGGNCGATSKAYVLAVEPIGLYAMVGTGLRARPGKRLELGADDYLIKQIAKPALAARRFALATEQVH